MTTKPPPWLLKAATHIGYREGPNNDNEFGRRQGMNHVPWCDLFVADNCEQSGHPLPSMQPGMKTGAAAVWYSMRFAQENGLWIRSWEARPGDQIVYGWDGPGSTPARMHTGFVEESGPRGTTGHTVEGNRGDAVGRFPFTVGAEVVLGCIDLNRLLLGRDKVHVRPPKPDPQPRNPDHPSHTGPERKPLSEQRRDLIAELTPKLERLADAMDGDRDGLPDQDVTAVRHLRDVADRVLHEVKQDRRP